jgi:hypothetical protein
MCLEDGAEQACDNQDFPNGLCGLTQQFPLSAQFGRSGLLIVVVPENSIRPGIAQ